MPIYVYRCASCDEEIERRQGFHDAPLTTCKDCGGALRRVLQPVGIVFKGSGFYVTDSRNGANGASKKAEDGASSDKPAASASDSGASSGTASTDSSSNGSTAKSEPSTTKTSKTEASASASK